MEKQTEQNRERHREQIFPSCLKEVYTKNEAGCNYEIFMNHCETLREKVGRYLPNAKYEFVSDVEDTSQPLRQFMGGFPYAAHPRKKEVIPYSTDLESEAWNNTPVRTFRIMDGEEPYLAMSAFRNIDGGCSRKISFDGDFVYDSDGYDAVRRTQIKLKDRIPFMGSKEDVYGRSLEDVAKRGSE